MPVHRCDFSRRKVWKLSRVSQQTARLGTSRGDSLPHLLLQLCDPGITLIFPGITPSVPLPTPGIPTRDPVARVLDRDVRAGCDVAREVAQGCSGREGKYGEGDALVFLSDSPISRGVVSDGDTYVSFEYVQCVHVGAGEAADVGPSDG